MDSVQKQVLTLSNKVDAMYEVVEYLRENVSAALSSHKIEAEKTNNLPLDAKVREYTYKQPSHLELAMTHKDVLNDSNEFNTNYYQSSEKELAPEIQIQRLTAQLTAAYNRIAALEEQLLSRRIYS